MAKETSPKKISLKSADNIVFEVELDIIKEMKTVQSFIEDDEASTTSAPIPLPNVFSPQLSKIIDYLHQQRKGKSESKEEFEVDFLTGVINNDLRELLNVVNYLNIEELLEFLTKAMADRIKNKSAEYVKRLFDVESNYTPEEEAKYRKENAWAFRGVDEDDDDE